MSAIPTQVLSDAFTEAVGASRGRVVEAALFTTFSLQPDFFEQEVLPTLFDAPFSTAPNVKLVQLEEALRKGARIAVFYDGNALETTGVAPALDVDRIAMARARGCFHPKLSLVLVREGDTRSLVMLVSSANLTRSGWWDNVEVSHACEIHQATSSHHRDPLRQVLDTLRGETRAKGSHVPALEAIDGFLKDQVTASSQWSRTAPLHPRLFVGDETLPTFIRDALGSSTEDLHLEIVSPYFDQSDAGALKALVERLKPASTTLYLPRDDAGRADCRPELYDAVLALGCRWGKWVTDIRRRSSQQSERMTERFVHAKVYRFWSKSPRREVVVLGSANLTRAAHAKGIAGNVEASVLLETANPSKLSSWFEVDEKRPLEFVEEPDAEDDVASGLPVAPIDIRYSWATGRAALHWSGDPPTGQVELRMLGSSLGAEFDVDEGWNDLPSEVAAKLEPPLKRTSFVSPFLIDSTGEAKEHQAVLVREEDMAHKPSLLFELSPEDILRYWSLLSEDQRNAFIENEGHSELVNVGLAAARARLEGSGENFFTRFAGIFHAFERLETGIRSALSAENWKDAEYQLFGKKYYSLPNLLSKLLKEEGGWDWVERYLALLTARDMTARLRRDHPAFWSDHERDAAQLDLQLEKGDALSKKLGLGDDQDGRAFLTWFEAQFRSDLPADGASDDAS